MKLSDYHALHAALAVREKRKRAHPEDDLQRAVCAYWRMAYPHSWAMTFHSPQGMAAKNRTLAAIFAGLGVKPGVFDLICIHRRGSFNGLALELKAARGVVSDAQMTWADYFRSEGWAAFFAYSFEEARARIDAYHGHTPPPEVLCQSESSVNAPRSVRRGKSTRARAKAHFAT